MAIIIYPIRASAQNTFYSIVSHLTQLKTFKAVTRLPFPNKPSIVHEMLWILGSVVGYMPPMGRLKVKGRVD